MCRFLEIFCFFFFILLPDSTLHAAIRIVPADFPTIQAAIDASSDGDTVLVAAGTYVGVGNRDISLRGKAITVTSENGPASSVIDCQGLGRGFFISQGEGTDTVISGFTILNGLDTHGGGIYIYYSSPTITNCIIKNSSATIFGGGLAGKGGQPQISDCTIENNTAPNSGGVHFQDNSKAILTNCTISDNVATGNAGGGIGSYSSSPTFSSCVILRNTSVKGGGGGYFENSPAIITGSTIDSNLTGVTGGGLSLNGSNVLISYTDIVFNKTTSTTLNSSGGGIFLTNSQASIISSDISFNESNVSYVPQNISDITNSGGISIHQGSNITLRNTTITFNKAQERGGIGSWNSAPIIESCDIWSNQATEGGGGGVGFYGDENAPLAEPIIRDSTVSGNYAKRTGGGIAIWQRSPLISNCLVDNNSSGETSGGINLNSSTQTAGSTARTKIINTIVSNNNSVNRAGIGVSRIGTGSITIVNTLITGNTATGISGGIGCYFDGHATITNCTVRDNTATNLSAALVVDSSDVVVTNSIFWGNSPDGISKSGTGTLTMTYSDVQGGYTGTGNVDVDPGFVAAGNSHLDTGSPCIDSGINTAAGLATIDLDKNVRIVDGIGDGVDTVDMGVYEYGSFAPPAAPPPAPFSWLLYFGVLNTF